MRQYDLKEYLQMKEALEEIRDLADGRADCDCVGDPPRFVPNEWMQVLVIAKRGLGESE